MGPYVGPNMESSGLAQALKALTRPLLGPIWSHARSPCTPWAATATEQCLAVHGTYHLLLTLFISHIRTTVA